MNSNETLRNCCEMLNEHLLGHVLRGQNEGFIMILKNYLKILRYQKKKLLPKILKFLEMILKDIR